MGNFGGRDGPVADAIVFRMRESCGRAIRNQTHGPWRRVRGNGRSPAYLYRRTLGSETYRHSSDQGAPCLNATANRRQGAPTSSGRRDRRRGPRPGRWRKTTSGPQAGPPRVTRVAPRQDLGSGHARVRCGAPRGSRSWRHTWPSVGPHLAGRTRPVSGGVSDPFRTCPGRNRGRRQGVAHTPISRCDLTGALAPRMRSVTATWRLCAQIPHTGPVLGRGCQEGGDKWQGERRSRGGVPTGVPLGKGQAVPTREVRRR